MGTMSKKTKAVYTGKYQFRLSEEEYIKLIKHSEEVGLTSSAFLRKLINGYNPTPKISEDFFNSIGEVRKFSYSIDRLSKQIEELGYVNENELKDISTYCKNFVIGLYKNYIDPKLIEEEKDNEETGT